MAKNTSGIEKHKFKKGQSGNPNGRPAGGKNFKTLLAEYLAKPMDIVDPVTKRKKKGTASEAVVIAQIGNAINGDTRAFIAIRDTVEGKPSQQIQLANTEGEVFKTESTVTAEVTVHNDIDYSQLSDQALKELAALRKKTNNNAATPTDTAKGTGKNGK